MVYKSCPDLSRLAGTAEPVVGTVTEYQSAFKPSAEYTERDNSADNATTKAANVAAAASQNDDDGGGDDVNEVRVYVWFPVTLQ